MKSNSREDPVVRQRRMLGAADDVVGRVAFAFEQQIGLADSVRFRVDLLPVR
jgi:hypothetical protein